ncbi:MAG: response regulator [Anaerolineales bacterium]|nr:response regulator [Anaerolineales bacterium]MCX7754284.1 response regulator [Anaerolineales bacterium]MDW8278681.1 response regulator [Anaerolineales bacterium]
MAEKILIIDDDLDTLRLVGLMLQKQGYSIMAASSGPQGLQMAFENPPDLVLLDVMMPGMDGYEVARQLRANQLTVNIPILMFTAKSQLDDKVTGFEAGADDYLTKPTHPSELQAHVKALLARSAKSRVNPPTGPSEAPAHLIGVLAARGGLGVTTVASNLAVAIQKTLNLSTILAEFRPGQGTLAYDLNLPKTTGLVELLTLPQAGQITRNAVKERLIVHPSGLDILVASPQPKDGVLQARIEHFEVLLNRLRYMAKYVIVDLGSGLTPLTQKLAPAFSELLVIVEPFEHSLRHSRALIDDLVETGVDKTRIRVAVNYRLRSEAQLSVPQVQDRLKYAIEVTFTPAPELMLQAIRMQTMAYLAQYESLTNQQYASLARKIETRAPRSTSS